MAAVAPNLPMLMSPLTEEQEYIDENDKKILIEQVGLISIDDSFKNES